MSNTALEAEKYTLQLNSSDRPLLRDPLLSFRLQVSLWHKREFIATMTFM